MSDSQDVIWIYGEPVLTDNTNYFWVYGEPYINLLSWQVVSKFVSTLHNLRHYVYQMLETNPNPTYIFQDGFESGNFSAWDSTSGVVSVETGNPHHGIYNGKAEVTGNHGAGYCRKNITPSPIIYTRGYYKVTALPTATNQHLPLAEIWHDSYQNSVAACIGYTEENGAVWELFDYVDGTAYHWYDTQGPEVDTWYCVEILRDVTNGKTKLWINGELRLDVDEAHVGDNNIVAHGVVYAYYVTANVYFDCTVISSSYIGPEKGLTYNLRHYVYQMLETNPNPEYLFQDSFESGDFSAWTGTEVSTGETMSVVSTVAHHGSYSAEGVFDGSTNDEYARCYKDITAQSTIFTRLYFRTNVTPPDSGDMLQFIRYSAAGNWIGDGGIYNDAGTLKAYARYYAGGIQTITGDPITVNTDTWYCLELKFVIDGVNGEIRLWLDGTEVLTATGLDTDDRGNISRVYAGPTGWSMGTVTAYVDCVVVSTEYIGPHKGLSYNIYNLRSKILSFLYGIEAGIETVAKSLSILWNLAGIVYKTISKSYNILNLKSKTHILTYSIRELLSRSASMVWSIFNLVSKSSAMKHSIQSLVSRALSSTYAIRNLASRALNFIYDIITIEIVARSISMSHSIFNLTSRSLAVLWSIAGSVVRTTVLKYNLKSIITNSLDIIHDIFNLMSRKISIVFHARSLVSSINVLKYAINSLISRAIKMLYSSAGSISSTLTLIYSSGGLISSTLRMIFDIGFIIKRAITLKFNSYKLSLSLKASSIVLTLKKLKKTLDTLVKRG